MATIEILEWALPEAWRAKLDLDGFVASQHSKERFIIECKAVERNATKNLKKVPNGGATKGKASFTRRAEVPSTEAQHPRMALAQNTIAPNMDRTKLTPRTTVTS